MTSRRSTARSRDIGQELLAIREKAGFDGVGLADRLGWDQSKVSRIEGGKQAIDEVDLIHWLSSCGVKGARLRKLVDHNREATKETWVLPYGPGSADSRNVVAEEREAKAITTYNCVLIPGLLQTPEYARAIARVFHDDEEVVEKLVALRTKRQEVLRGEKAPKVTFFVEEAVLRKCIGSPQVMHDQLMHLMFMADWKNVCLRVIPEDAGAHMAGDGAFVLIERRDKRWVAYVNTRATTVILEADDHIASYEETIKGLERLALDAGESRRFIAELAGGQDRRREAPDDRPGDLA
ncbi:helix-turn-helix domain-containing protein [Lentzea tibetensis]|uniref:Helix-turn-helix domain-containing protein n=1 Tax=Lentzea tibetensis TaxID=2591470 RepID=A0A563ELZ2_9PSEU|nr:helix-turn-helix transcriptional regulator [Lentzea tibetensis]TWP47508.1 helix-turn-helix domain-containing protein [Lentzea tibetensis]